MKLKLLNSLAGADEFNEEKLNNEELVLCKSSIKSNLQKNENLNRKSKFYFENK